jgi:hypothetical protein
MFGLLGEANELPIILFIGLDENPQSILNSHQQDESMLHCTYI